MLGVFFMIVDQIDSYMFDNPTNMIAIFCTFIGLFISLMAIFMKAYPIKRYGKANFKSLQYEIISKWKELEAIMVQLTPVEKHPILKEMIDYLNDLNIINQEDCQNIKIY